MHLCFLLYQLLASQCPKILSQSNSVPSRFEIQKIKKNKIFRNLSFEITDESTQKVSIVGGGGLALPKTFNISLV